MKNSSGEESPGRGISIVRKQLSIANQEYLELFRQWMEHKRYSDSSIRTYTSSLKYFLVYLQPKKAEDNITGENMVHFVNGFIIPGKLSYTFQNQVINAVKLFY